MLSATGSSGTPHRNDAVDRRAGFPVIDHDKHRDLSNAVRALAIDAVEAAGSGHPGLPLGAADIATVLFTQFLKFDPTEPRWPDRDRFILSAGHGSMLLYALLHLTGYEDMQIQDIKTFRRLGSRAAGHPEFGLSSGIETTTGPLGQGLATAVGMAIAERHLAARFGDALVNHHSYALVSDGDLMEGISHEAIALAGNLKLSKLILLFDDNGITIDGSVSLTDTVDQIARFKACGWNATRVDGHDPQAISDAIATARDSERPSLIACRTIIGYGAPNKQGTSGAHGSPLGATEAAGARAALDWHHEPFEIPNDIRDNWRIIGLRGVKARKAWNERLKEQDSTTQGAFNRCMNGELPTDIDMVINRYKESLIAAPANLATRKASELALDIINSSIPETIGGSADLTGSNNTRSKDMTILSADDYAGRFIHYGIREHGMAAAMNGMALHGGVIPYSGTFLVFSDYCRPSIRLAALMKQRVIHVMTHDSIGLGEDGPTHQPIEHLASLRAIPNLLVMRPCDTVETIECWQMALHNTQGPSILALSRQNLPQLRHRSSEKNLSAPGGYILIATTMQEPQVVLIATGSEVQIAVAAHKDLEAEGIAATVISMPCLERFEAQSQSYRDHVIPPHALHIVIEAGSSLGWDRHIGKDGAIMALDRFGESAPQKDLYDHFGITAEAVITVVKERLETRRKIKEEGKRKNGA